MQELVDAVRSEPKLVKWLGTDAWRKGFDRGSLGRAEDYANDRAIHISELDRHADNSLRIVAKVKGTRKQPYETHIGFYNSGSSWVLTRAECSCPVGLYCKHAAAVILAVRWEVLPRPVTAPPVEEKPAVSLSPLLHTWLEKIRRDRSNEAKAATRSTAIPPAEKRFLAFCLQPAGRYYDALETWLLIPRIGNRLKDGAFSLNDTPAKPDPSNPPKYMKREDFIAASLYYQRRRSHSVWNEMQFTGDGWEDLLDALYENGRFFVQAPDGKSWLPAVAGPPLHVTAAWDALPDGSARPALEFAESATCSIVPTVPPRYIDRATGTIGLLESNLQPAMLAGWMNGPTVPAPQVQLFAESLRETLPDLPPPVPMETIEEERVKPRCHLLVREGKVGNGYNARRMIRGLVRFSYGDSELLPPLHRQQPTRHWQIRDGKRHVWERDPAAERATTKQLHAAGLMPLYSAFPIDDRDPDDLNAVLPTPRSSQGDWLLFLESPAAEMLRAAGWNIDVDPSLGLVVHDAGDFFSTIETDPDHGIDWFKFDARFEVDGKQISLIPIIAAAIARQLPAADSPDLPAHFVFPHENPAEGSIRFPARRLMEIVGQVRHLFMDHRGDGPVRMDRFAAAGLADALAIDSSATLRSLAQLARNLRDITSLPAAKLPKGVKADLRPYQLDGFSWLQFLAANSLHGILADDMGLGKTLQTLAHLAAEAAKLPGRPSLVVAPTSVVSNWTAEAAKFTPGLSVLTLHGKDRSASFDLIPKSDLVITSYALLNRDSAIYQEQDWHLCVLDEAQYIKNSKTIIARNVYQLRAAHRLCLSGTPMENHLGELWSLMRFLMPGFLGDETVFNSRIRRPIERDRSGDAQLALNRRVSPLVLRRTKDAVASELPPKTELIHTIDLAKSQSDLYESVRAAMDRRVRDAISAQGLAKSHIIVLDALLKLRQICCHPALLKAAAASGKPADSAKLDFLTDELFPTLIEEGRRILVFSSFTSMLALIEDHLKKQKIPHLKLTGSTKDRASLVEKFQTGASPVFLISLKAGGTGLNLTAADTVIHYDPWWNPAAENQATDRAHRIGQTKPVFIHKLVCRGSIEERILELQKHKAALVEALLSEETGKLRIDTETLSHLLAPLV